MLYPRASGKEQSRHRVVAAGPHTLRVWAIDPSVVFQKFVLNTDAKLKSSYLSPPESFRRN
jgi:hypothetical protein